MAFGCNPLPPVAGLCQLRQPTCAAEAGHVLPRSAGPCRLVPDRHATFASPIAGPCRTGWPAVRKPVAGRCRPLPAGVPPSHVSPPVTSSLAHARHSRENRANPWPRHLPRRQRTSHFHALRAAFRLFRPRTTPLSVLALLVALESLPAIGPLSSPRILTGPIA